MDAEIDVEYIQLKVRGYHWNSTFEEPFDTILYTWIKKNTRQRFWEDPVCLGERMVHLNEDS